VDTSCQEHPVCNPTRPPWPLDVPYLRPCPFSDKNVVIAAFYISNDLARTPYAPRRIELIWGHGCSTALVLVLIFKRKVITTRQYGACYDTHAKKVFVKCPMSPPFIGVCLVDIRHTMLGAKSGGLLISTTAARQEESAHPRGCTAEGKETRK
jgi:hypothetical protein